MGDSLLAVVLDDGTVTFLSEPRSHFVDWLMGRDEITDRLPRRTEHLSAGAWVIAATDGLTDFVSGLTQTLAKAAESQAKLWDRRRARPGRDDAPQGPRPAPSALSAPDRTRGPRWSPHTVMTILPHARPSLMYRMASATSLRG
jgi:hypothetical protein